MDTQYYLNQCNSSNKEKSERINGYIHDWHNVENKKVEVIGRWVSNGEDDVDYELNEVIIHNV